MKNKKLLWQLFKETFILSAFTLGGGYVIISLMQKRFVEELKWIQEDEMLDLVAIAQTSPGAVAINTSVALGYRMANIIGAVVTVVATALPPMIVLTILYYIYDTFKTNEIVSLIMSGMQIGVTAVILDVVITMIVGVTKQKDWVSYVTLLLTVLVTILFKINILIVVIIMTIIGILLKVIQKRGYHVN